MRLTSKEKEFVEVLKKEPLISQEELAQYFGISRSSVGVHISNLMKKGIIRGKGYVVNEQISVVLMGESYLRIDIEKLQDGHRIDTKYKGIVTELCDLFFDFGFNVKVVTVLGHDEVGQAILNNIRQKKIDTANIYQHPFKRSSRKVFIDNNISYQEIFAEDDYVKALVNQEWLVLNCNWLVTDPYITEILHNQSLFKGDDKLPLLATYKLIKGSEKLPEYLSRYALLTVGVTESECLENVAERFLGLAVNPHQRIVVTDGISRIIYIENNKLNDFPLLPNQRFDSRERLPLLMAGLIYGLSNNYPIRQVIRIAIGTASINE